jgi:type IV secretory pathway VirB4 component
VAFQPLARIDRRDEQIWASRFVVNLLAAQHVAETPDIKRDVDEAIALTATAPRNERTLSNLVNHLGRLDLKEALRPYTVAGNYGQIFDADRDDVRGGFWQMFEMGHLMALGQDAVVPALDYLFHRVEEQLDGRPTLMVLDEAWLFLSHPIFMRRLQGWLKTLRKKNVYVVFATQEVADATESPITATIVSACHTKIYLPDDEALTPQMTRAYRDFGLSDTEIGILARAQKKRDYYYRSVNGRRLFRLDLGPVGLAFAGMSSPDDQKALDRIVGETAASGEVAEKMLRHRGLGWAAELVAEARASGRAASGIGHSVAVPEGPR